MDEGIQKMLAVVIAIALVLMGGLLAFKFLGSTNKPVITGAMLQSTTNYANGKYYTTISLTIRITGGSAPYNISTITIATDQGTITLKPSGSGLTATLPSGVALDGNVQGQASFNGQDSITLILESAKPLHITGGTVNIIDSNGNTASAALSILST